MMRWGILSAMGVFMFTQGMASGADVDAFRIDLDGTWQAQAIRQKTWEEAAAPDTAGTWRDVPVPFPSWPQDAPAEFKTAPGIWLRRTFQVPAQQAKLDAVLHWEIVRWGFSATLNGRALGETLLYAPGEMPVPAGVLKAGDNELVLKVRNWDALPRGGERRHPLVPAGSAWQGWGSKSSMIAGSVEFRLFDHVRIAHVRMASDAAAKKAIANLELVSVPGAGPGAVEVRVRVTDEAGAELGTAVVRQTLEAKNGAPLPCQVEVPLAQFPVWTPEHPRMVRAEVTLVTAEAARRTLDARTVAFGLRTFEVRDGHFLLNGERFWLRGSNLVHDWLWSEDRFRNTGGSFKSYVVDTARGMSVNCFRTHTLPPSHTAADVCDRGGMLLLAEMPLTYNGSGTGLDPAQERQYRANARQMILAWVRELANHPAVIVWVPVNEPPMGEKNDLYGWTQNVVYPAIKAADPSRPVLFAAEESPDIQDIHCYAGYWGGAEGEFYEFIQQRADTRDPKRTLMNTEYIEGMPPERTFRWTGQTEKTAQAGLVYAMFGMEQTEGLRRLGYDGILPYMFSGWTRGNWRPSYPTPMYAALSSALAPVAVSVDLFDRNYLAGASLAADVWIMNDQTVPSSGELRVYLCRKNPEFVPETVADAEATLVQTVPVKLGPAARKIEKITVTLPNSEGRLYLAAVLTPPGGRPVMSQRELRVLAPNETPASVRQRKYRVIGPDAEALAWLRARNIRFEVGAPFTKIEPDVDMVVVWEDARIDAPTATMAGWISEYVGRGGKLLLLRHERWNQMISSWWQFPHFDDGQPLAYDTRPDVASAVFASPGAENSPLFRGIPREYLLRWNGQLGAICRESLLANFLDSMLPATLDGLHYSPSRPGSIVMEGEAPIASNFVVDEFDPRFVERRDGKLTPLVLKTVRTGSSLLLTRTKPPDAYTAAYEFQAEKAMDGELWVYEHGRRGSAPFAWRVDDAAFQTVSAGAPTMAAQRVRDKEDVWFAWTNCGNVHLEPGRHRLEIRVTQPAENGTYLLSQDHFMIAPRATGRTLCVSGSRQPILAQVQVGKGEVTITQTLFRGRLLREASHYDPAAERLLLNLLGF